MVGPSFRVGFVWAEESALGLQGLRVSRPGVKLRSSFPGVTILNCWIANGRFVQEMMTVRKDDDK